MTTVSPSGNTTAAVTYTPIATQTLSSAASSVTFSSIPGTYKDLVLITQAKGSTALNQLTRVGNGSVDTGSNYSITLIGADYVSPVSTRTSSATSMQLNYDTFIDSTFFTQILQLQNYANTTTYKSVLARSNMNDGNYGIDAAVGLWRSTSAINIITFSTGGGSYAAGSTFTLYGIGA